MANRTFKVYGQAYAESGDVSVAMTVNGTEVFNGAVSDSTTPRVGQPTTENQLWTYELDENTTGNLSVSIAVTGGELCFGPTFHNLSQSKAIPMSWFEAQGTDILSTANQTYMATNIGQAALDAQQAGLYDKLVAGTVTAPVVGGEVQVTEETEAILRANELGPRTVDDFVPAIDVRDNLTVSGQSEVASTAEEKALWWPIVADGETLTYDWTFDPDSNQIS